MSWLYSEEDVTRVVETETHYAPTALVWGLPSNIPPHVNRSGRTQSWASCGLPLTDCDANMCQMRSTAKRLLLYFCGALSPCIVASGTCQEAAFLEVHLVSACLSMHSHPHTCKASMARRAGVEPRLFFCTLFCAYIGH